MEPNLDNRIVLKKAVEVEYQSTWKEKTVEEARRMKEELDKLHITPCTNGVQM